MWLNDTNWLDQAEGSNRQTVMPISRGTHFGTYEITGAIGAGGMGEVYQAHDTKLGRDVRKAFW